MSAVDNTAKARTVCLRYGRKTLVRFDGTQSDVVMALEADRFATTPGSGPRLTGRVKDGALLRDALATLFAVRDSDLRYRGKDRSAYFAYLLSKGKRAGAAVWEAQKAFIAAELEGATQVAEGLDPVMTVGDDEASMEVFSRDESAYARLALSLDLFDDCRSSRGTSFFHLPPSFALDVGRLRSYLPVHFDAGEGDAQETHERTASVSDAWLKSFLQVQSAAMLPQTICEITPVDLYNILYVLTVRRAKKAPRSLRFELVPGKTPRIVIEPFGIVLEMHGAPYQGSNPAIIRTYGRQRLLALSRLLPHVTRVRVCLLGPGLPVFWVLDLGSRSGDKQRFGEGAPVAGLTLGFSGWTDASWSSAATFDRLVPAAGASKLADDVVRLLETSGAQSLRALVDRLKLPAEKVRAALQRACLRGEIVYDVSREVFRRRPLFSAPVEDDATRAASPREARALRFVETKGSVAITKEHVIAGQGLEVRGEVKDLEARRTYTPRFTLDLEGRVTEAWCNCPTFARSALREGPCEHMLALRTQHARERAQAEASRDTPEGRAKIRAETRSLLCRHANGAEERCRISLDMRRVRLAWSLPAGQTRHQALEFDTEDDARDEYFGRLSAMASKGFIDASDGSGEGASAVVP